MNLRALKEDANKNQYRAFFENAARQQAPVVPLNPDIPGVERLDRSKTAGLDR